MLYIYYIYNNANFRKNTYWKNYYIRSRVV